MGSQGMGGKDATVGALKVLVALLNEKSDDQNYKLGRPFCLEDFDNLTSELMLKLVMFLMSDMIGDKPISKPAPLSMFNQFGVGEVAYDSGIDQIYQDLKQIFPEDSDFFHFSVLLLPAADPKRTKAVLAYIVNFVFMCDYIQERFLSCYDDVIKANEEKVAICAEIDDLKEQINAKIQDKETSKERLPVLQREIHLIEEKIRKEQNILAKLNVDVEKHKVVYEDQENKLKQRHHQLDLLKAERIELENQIVPNPNEILDANTAAKNQLEAETKRRDAIGLELNALAKQCCSFDSLIDRAKDTISNFENALALLESTKHKLLAYTKSGNAISTQSKNIDNCKKELHNLQQLQHDKIREIIFKKDFHSSRKQAILDKITSINMQAQKVKATTKQRKKVLEDLKTSNNEIHQEIQTLKQNIAQYMKTVNVDIPKRKRDAEADYLERLKALEDQFKVFIVDPK